MSEMERSNVLKDYYAQYLTRVRKSSDSTVKHYLGALNTISQILKEKKLVDQDIYEIGDLERLFSVRTKLYEDLDFIEKNTRGKRMYSAGLNNYCRFAAGEDFVEISASSKDFDMPVAPEDAIVIEQKVWKRSGILKTQVLELANYTCTMDKSHETFISEARKKPYMEAHHAIPMNCQNDFDVSLDVHANLICMCPICHRKIHYGIQPDRIYMLEKIFDERIDRFKDCGINVRREEFKELALGK